MTTKLLITFIGECRSLTAIRKGWSWMDGRLVHPAARGRIRKRHRYHKHVRDTLGPALRRRSAG